ncbi:hypothetical protein FQR65_LT08736 [Abscondita terminalis]|nr:hypothetical protein FQR65_LT08736 [Abscondita terminalis]
MSARYEGARHKGAGTLGHPKFGETALQWLQEFTCVGSESSEDSDKNTNIQFDTEVHYHASSDDSVSERDCDKE